VPPSSATLAIAGNRVTESNERRGSADPFGRADNDNARLGLSEAHRAEQNRLLHSLPLEEYDLLLSELKPVRLDLKHVLVEPNVPITDVWFVRSGVASMLATEQDGGAIEVGTIGNEGFVGLPILFMVDSMPYRVLIQIEGDAWRMSAAAFRRLVDERPALRHLCLRFAQYFSDQMAQSVACNRLHTVEERCARWILMTHDRVHGDRFELTQEFLALMLGVRRAGVSVAMGVLQRAGILSYVRGRVVILDRAKLEEAACNCYGITRDAQSRLVVEGPRIV
jgi:CRP-like cAMP-binding protein